MRGRPQKCIGSAIRLHPFGAVLLGSLLGAVGVLGLVGVLPRGPQQPSLTGSAVVACLVVLLISGAAGSRHLDRWLQTIAAACLAAVLVSRLEPRAPYRPALEVTASVAIIGLAIVVVGKALAVGRGGRRT